MFKSTLDPVRAILHRDADFYIKGHLVRYPRAEVRFSESVPSSFQMQFWEHMAKGNVELIARMTDAELVYERLTDK
jgi:hypothetical protein